MSVRTIAPLAASVAAAVALFGAVAFPGHTDAHHTAHSAVVADTAPSASPLPTVNPSPADVTWGG